MPSTLRMKRINDRIKEILSTMLLTKISDPRLEGVSVTDVRVDRELDFANIYVSSLDGEARSREVIAALNHARGFLRHNLAEEIDLRVMPRLRFFWDPTPERANRIDNLIARLQAEEAHVEEPPDEDESDGLPEEEENGFVSFHDDEFIDCSDHGLDVIAPGIDENEYIDYEDDQDE